MKRSLRSALSALITGIAGRVGLRLRDARTGESLGRALVIPWRGRIVVIGLKRPVKVSFRPQERLTYWKQEIEFTAPDEVDFPSERRSPD